MTLSLDSGERVGLGVDKYVQCTLGMDYLNHVGSQMMKLRHRKIMNSLAAVRAVLSLSTLFPNFQTSSAVGPDVLFL